MMWKTNGLSWLARGAWAGVMAVALSGCEMLLPKDAPSAGAGAPGLRITAGTKKRPVIVARACYQTLDRMDELAARADDVAAPVRKMVSMGNGSLEMGFQNAAGEWIDGLESGGALLIPGTPAEEFRLLLKNASRSPIEVRVRVGGRDLFSGKVKAWDHAGVEIEPGKTLVLDKGWRSDGTEYPLTFVSVPDTNAPLSFQPNGRIGLIQVGVFALDQEDRMTTAVPEPGWKKEAVPFMPKTAPYQYR